MDPLREGQDDRYPTIGGLCRPQLSLNSGDIRVYVTSIDPRIPAVALTPYVNPRRWPPADGTSLYALVAVLQIEIVYASHLAAKNAFDACKARIWIPGEPPGPYPPNLFDEGHPNYLVPGAWCIAYYGQRPKPYLPTSAGFQHAYNVNVKAYISRANQQKFAVCKAFYLNSQRPTVITDTDLLTIAPADNPRFPAGNVSGRQLTRAQLDALLELIQKN
ncbi:MAG: hypothetical protein OWU33_09790 [Firmicutes bacterium]|nr:hypothetical protein [Bacillota bacterium]